MNNPIVYSYKGSEISFMSGENVMVNATEMAKPFGKTTKDWLRTNASIEFINSLSAVRQICPSQLVVVRKGNSNEFEQGTWMHEDVALEFARWLSPAFAIWCNDRIKELLKHGITATPQTIESILADPANGIKLLQALQVVQNSLNKKYRIYLPIQKIYVCLQCYKMVVISTSQGKRLNCSINTLGYFYAQP